MSQQNYLNAMGIMSWKLRSCPTEAVVVTSIAIFPLLLGSKTTQGYLLIDGQSLQDNAISQLLDKMLQAIGLHRGAKTVLNEIQLTSQHWALIMGRDLQCGLNISQFKIFDHPAELLQNPSKKRDAWTDLQYVAKHWIQQ